MIKYTYKHQKSEDFCGLKISLEIFKCYVSYNLKGVNKRRMGKED